MIDSYIMYIAHYAAVTFALLQSFYVLDRDRIKLNVRIQRLPNEWHTLTQALRIECSARNLRRERCHLSFELGRGLSSRRIRLLKDIGLVEHVQQSPIRVFE